MQIEDVVKKYSDMLYRLALAKTGNRHDAEDIVQEVFLKLVTSGKQFVDDEHRKAWLIRVTVNAGHNVTRSAFRRRNAGELDENMYSGNTGCEHIKQIETQSVVYPAVMALDEKYRVIIHLFYYEDLPIADICKATGLNENTVKTRLRRARNMLKKQLREVDFDE